MKKTSVLLFAAILLIISPVITSAASDITYHTESDESLAVELLGRYSSGAEIDDGGTEIVAYDPHTAKAYSVNGSKKTLDIIDLSVLAEGEKEIPLDKQIKLSDFGVDAGDLTSVAIDPESRFIAVAVPAENKVENGNVVIMSTEGDVLTTVEVGALPDMVSITPDGNHILVANEAEPGEDYTVNPEGSVTIIDVSEGVTQGATLQTKTAFFTDKIVEKGVRKVHPDSTYAQDLEPEYIVVDEASKYAYVVLQEDNAMAKLDIETGEFVTVESLGYKDFSAGDNKLDASDKDDKINIRNWPVLSMYQPDGMDLIEMNGKTYILTANEGDAQDWDGFSEEARVEDLVGDDAYQLNADLYQGYSQEELDQMVEEGLFKKEQLGRLGTSTSHPVNEEGKYEAIYGYGARSFSVWDAETLELVYDSGSDFEEKIAAFMPEYFHSNNDEDSFESRSDDKGVEPESVITGEVAGTTYAFVGLERQGGIMVYDMTNPASPSFDSYFSSRTFQGLDAGVDTASGDVTPEGLTFIKAEDSPTNEPILLAAHEVSGTIAVYELGVSSDSGLQELTINNGELTPAFSPGQYEYQVEVGHDVDDIQIAARTSSADAHVLVNGMDPSESVALEDGMNAINVDVVAEDGSASTYLIVVNKLLAHKTEELRKDGDSWKLETDIQTLDDKATLELIVPDSEGITDSITFSAEQIQQLKEKNITVMVKKSDVQLTFDMLSFSTGETLTLLIDKMDKADYEQGDQSLTDIFDLSFQQSGQAISEFVNPVHLSFALAEKKEDSALYYWNATEAKWSLVEGEPTFHDGWLTVATDHFSIYSVFNASDLVEESADPVDPDENGTDTDEEEPTTPPSTDNDNDTTENELPDTATNMYTLMVLGGILLLVGMVIVVVKKNPKFAQ
ncbi:choice-of-anchor I family protein [Gracilibacillus caseinilyticus]|uniref:Choice-of-anchor I family protein n=1 Tax=Gracilibacillus caseinilyticus TaxID=2932256 RepID=A0ABY4ESN1_9BACI|nr:choice-of-anchor I family protein [Gracilibacillus caseinilyticus]UOQ46664.1 choice-of-anchor I family protein [Gracilibacillus caseinilyticus]